MPSKRVENEEPEATNLESLPTPSLASTDLRMSYRIARGEQGVLTFEPYKSILLPHWRFKTVAIAENSSKTLYQAFTFYTKAGDLVGADMARKFIQMGMTRAKRYANHRGGKKYDRSAREVEKEGGERVELPKSEAHDGREEKLQASNVFKEVWKRCTSDERYVELKEDFLAEQKVWDRQQKARVKDEGKVVKRERSEVKSEVKEEDDD